MGRDSKLGCTIEPHQVEAYLRRRGFPDAHLLSLNPLGADTDSGLKSFGYGRPVLARFHSGGDDHAVVVRTMAPDPFGHDRRADRGDAMLLSFDTFNTIPRHIRAVDVGAFCADGEMLPMGRGEIFLITEYVEGALYADDLFRLEKCAAPTDGDRQRVVALAEYLVALHAEKVEPQLYIRHLRDTLGSGEGIFGLSDAYAEHPEVADAARLEAIEKKAVGWRWKMRSHASRACRTHGDFHPFNILFREGVDFSVLDCSRGAAGEAADDLTCLSINFLFFALDDHGRFDGALRELWDVFWTTYLTQSGDREVLRWVAPYFTWRALVLASPVWYPDLAPAVREHLLRFAEQLLDGAAFRPDAINEFFEGGA